MRLGVLGIRAAPPALGAAVVIGLNIAVGAIVWRLFGSGRRLKP